MLLTSVDPRAHQHHQQEVSKLSQWLAIKSDNLAEESTAQNQQQPAINNIATNFYSNGHAQQASFASPEHSSDFSSADGRSSSLSMVDTGSIGSQATRRNWNVHANPFHPTAYQMMGPQNGAFVRPKQEAMAMRMEQPAMKMGMEPFMGHGQPQNDGGIFQSFPPVPQQQYVQQSHQQNFFQQMPNVANENGNGLMDNSSNVWQDPNAELYRWQQYTGTGVWGKPEEKVTKPIKRWQDLSDTDEGIPQQQNTNANANGWGELPSITVGTYGRIQQLQHFGGRSTPTIQTGGGNVDFRPNQAQMPQIFPTLPHQQPHQHFHGGIPQAQLGHGIGLGGGSRISGPVAPTPKWSSFEPVDPTLPMAMNGGGQYSAAMVFPGQGMNMNAGGFGFADNGFQGFIPKRNNFPLAMQPHHFACLPINGGPSMAGFGEA